MFPLLFGSVFLIVGLVPLWLAFRTFAKDRAIAKWPRAPGRMLQATIESHASRERDQDGYDRTYTYHDPVVRYAYTVGERELEGNQLARSVPSSTTAPDLSRYAPGTPVQVFYDPADPTVAYLETRVSTGAIVLSILGGVFVVIGVLVPTLVLLLG